MSQIYQDARAKIRATKEVCQQAQQQSSQLKSMLQGMIEEYHGDLSAEERKAKLKAMHEQHRIVVGHKRITLPSEV